MLGLAPAAAGDANAEAHEAQVGTAMGVCAQGQLYPQLPRSVGVNIFQVESAGHSVDF